jgi:phospholipid/cholesterol/gamma-HCH transport system substrate-binding protein
VLVLVFLQFRGVFQATTKLTMIAARAGLSLDPRSKVTYNGVEIGRVTKVEEVTQNGTPKAKFTLDVYPKYIRLIPKNVDANIKATTVFGQKYVSFTSPKNPTRQRISSKDVIDATSVTTEFNTLFETITSIAEKVDPVKLNATLSATAQALNGLGDKFGQSIINGNDILADLNPQQPQVRYDIQKLADLADTYADASPDLWDFLENVVTTSRTLNNQRGDLDAALTAAIGFGNAGEDIFRRGGPYLARGQHDLVPTAQLLDEYSPMLFCTIRNFHDIAPAVAASLGGNGYSLNTVTELLGSENPWVYPDNLPRVNAKGGPHGKPGCWAPISRDLWPAPWLVMDTGASLAPYNHFAIAQPIFQEYVWGRQFGEFSINP